MFPQHGIEVFSLDQPGFGDSEGPKRGVYANEKDMFGVL
jgi:alpha-beta hydrolase superfamily lysophospholipase